jgi:hypothetical protein
MLATLAEKTVPDTNRSNSLCRLVNFATIISGGGLDPYRGIPWTRLSVKRPVRASFVATPWLLPPAVGVRVLVDRDFVPAGPAFSNLLIGALVVAVLYFAREILVPIAL